MKDQDQSQEKGLIAWFATNSVAANLLMIFIILGGLFTYFFEIDKQMFPNRQINWIDVHISYPGAAPQEVEEGITIKIEESLKSLQGLKRVITYSNRSSSSAYIEIDDDYDGEEILNEVKAQIDSISSFPDGMERPRVSRRKPRQEVMYLSLYGDLTAAQLKDLGKQIHNEIQNLPSVSVSEFYGGPSYEIGIEISKEKLREYGLSFRDVANTVRSFSANRSAGQIRAEKGYISMRVENQAYTGIDFENLPLLNLSDGSQLLLGDVAKINDGFVEGIRYSKFNGKNATTYFIGATRDQSITDVADEVNKFIAKKQSELPQGVNLEAWVDMTYYLSGRLNMMIDNMKFGGLLVFLMLALFLRLRLAFWVMLGLPVAFLGAILFLPAPFVGVSINVVSLFAFILVLGIVVDDAIVIGESVHHEVESKGHSLQNVIRGAKRVAIPATFGVLTTVAAFVPLVIADGPGSAESRSIGFVVILCLLFSLVESKLILPAHLANMSVKPENPRNPFYKLRAKIDAGLKNFIDNRYQPFLTKAIHYRYTVLSVFVAILLVSIGLLVGGHVKVIMQPKIPHDFVDVNVDMEVNSTEQTTMAVVKAMEQMVLQVDEQIKQEFGTGMVSDIQSIMRNRTAAQLTVKLVDPEFRPMDTFALTDRWRPIMPDLPGMKTVHIRDSLMQRRSDDGDISFKLEGSDPEQLKAAANELKAKLQTYAGVGEVSDSMQSVTEEVQLELKPLAYNLGLNLSDVASQVSFGFYGLEAQRILRNGEELRVMIRYPHQQRNSISQVQHVLIKTPDGSEVPLSEIAHVKIVDGVSRIRRENGQRTISIWASVDDTQAEPIKITNDVRKEYIPKMLENYSQVNASIAGNIRDTIEGQTAQLRNFGLALLLIFTLLAIPLKSYSQPLIIMSVIPFGVIGAMVGHIMLDMNISSLSLFGIIAASGVVVNDSLVMVDFINRARLEGVALKEAVISAGCRRFRAIFLTSLTTFVGLIPIITETSLQAKLVVPMAISLAFGVLFATVVTLLLIPCLYVIWQDFPRIRAKISSGFRPTPKVLDTYQVKTQDSAE